MGDQRAHTKETSSLSQSCKGPARCYGATRNPESAPDFKLVLHILSPTDTLQGLAIKYGVTVEQIRRANKLWTSDNILIYKTLNIPVKIQVDCNDGIEDCEEVNSGDIDIDMRSNLEDRTEGVYNAIHSKNGDSLSKFLNKLDDQMKSSTSQAEKQRTNSGATLINDLETHLGKTADNRVELSKTRQTTLPRKKQSLFNKPGRSSLKETNSIDNKEDDLFEL